MYKNENISTGEFNKFMTQNCPQKAGPVAQKNGILQYATVCYIYLFNVVFPAHTIPYPPRYPAYLPLNFVQYNGTMLPR